MTRNEARELIERYEAGRLSVAERKHLVETIAIFMLRALLSVPDGRLEIALTLPMAGEGKIEIAPMPKRLAAQ